MHSQNNSNLVLDNQLHYKAVLDKYETSRAAEFRACSLEDQQHHHIDKDGCVGSTSSRADKQVATLDEIMATSKSGQCAIVDMVTRLSLFSKSVQAPRCILRRMVQSDTNGKVDIFFMGIGSGGNVSGVG
ncbi:hypothetical protein Tco_0547953 [Tanacetum coccineum]